VNFPRLPCSTIFFTGDFTRPWAFGLLVAFLFVGITGRYLLIAGFFHLYFYQWYPERWRARKLGQPRYPAGQFQREVGWSLLNAALFALVGALTVVAFQRGYTAIYLDPAQYGWWYLPVSLGLSLFLHETYYYWIHRLMHHPRVYRYVHRVHHDSRITSPWTAFSFHPIEGVLQAVIFPLLLVVVPMHPVVISLQLLLMTLSAAINHLDIEIYPRSRLGSALGRRVIGATHHGLHHRQFRYNFGLHFTFWDRWGRTESPLFRQQFEERAPLD
jgi:lathosterol oxidase